MTVLLTKLTIWCIFKRFPESLHHPLIYRVRPPSIPLTQSSYGGWTKRSSRSGTEWLPVANMALVKPESSGWYLFYKLKLNACGRIGKAFGLFSSYCHLGPFWCWLCTGVYTLVPSPGQASASLWALTFASAWRFFSQANLHNVERTHLAETRFERDQ